MWAEFLGEDDKDIGLSVTDNNGGEHQIEMHKRSGEIYAHQCEAYADRPSNRTRAENQHNEQARRYARYHVYHERGYATLPRFDRPDHIDAVRRALQQLPDAEFEEFFAGTLAQLRSHFDEDVDRPVTLPSGVPDEQSVLYKQDVYLGVDLTEPDVATALRDTAAEIDIDVERLDSRLLTDLSDQDVRQWERVGEALEQTVEGDVDAELDLRHGAVSGLHVAYPQHGEMVTDRASDPFEREPDATLELLPMAHDSLEAFRAYLDHHLRCQIRDRFVSMGVVPPNSFRVLGLGTFLAYRRYTTYDIYPELHDPEADLSLLTQWSPTA